MNYIYIIECKDGTLYTGWTNNLTKRINTHNKGKGSKYTRSRFPVVLKYFELFTSKGEALRREYEIKKMSRIEKLNLINNDKDNFN
ncbi:putative endonuclease [Desulfonispora thiosulfatigenes DSM 11270]|uniref:Putative endonuclease n=1 Tax=Desulfonispora thiosulfatigenes DSM 11270 TaxID=656914 RepID=A0A1W1VU64_DESTI|nr:GIY-YIG nuclease family protein [Desulfonispora thiosulfatigenes]SMB96651.1 putative endonuclease [Desulfonispora thiosulfatigenes DSM 11270]